MNTRTILASVTVLFAVNVFAESEIMGRWQNLTNYDKYTVGAAMNHFLTNCSQSESLQLCEEIGQMIDSGARSGESIEIGLFLMGLYRKGELTPEMLLDVVVDKTQSETWRLGAANCLCGSGQLIDLSQTDIRLLYDTFTHLILDTNETLLVRKCMARMFSGYLEERYHWIYAPEKAKRGGRDYSLSTATATGKLLEHEKYVNDYMGFVDNMLVSDDVPSELRITVLVSAIGDLTRVRGAKTPGLGKIKKALVSLTQPPPEATGTNGVPSASTTQSEVLKTYQNIIDKIDYHLSKNQH